MPQASIAPEGADEQHRPNDPGAYRRVHAIHILRLTRDQQIALVQEARAARKAEQVHRAGSCAVEKLRSP